MNTYYFTFDTDETFPFQGGWVEVLAPTRKAAAQIFQQYFPDEEYPYILNCADCFSQEEFEKRKRTTGDLEGACHLVIGPHKPDRSLNTRQDAEKAAPGAANTESGKELNNNFSVSPAKGNVKPIELFGCFSLDEDGNAYFETIPVGEIIGYMLRRSGYARLKIEVLRDEYA